MIDPPSPPRPRRFQFSLRTLVSVALLSGSAMALWRNRAPWVLDRELKGFIKPAINAVFSHDGRRVAACGFDNTVRIWDVASGQSVHVFDDHPTHPIQVAFSPNDRFLASCDRSSIAIVRNLETMQWQSTIQALGTRARELPEIDDIRFTPDNQCVITVGHYLKYWNAKSGQPLFPLKNDASWFKYAEFSPQGDLLAAASGTTVQLFNPATRELLRAIDTHVEDVDRVSFSPDGKKIATIHNNLFQGTQNHWDAATWDAQTGKYESSITLPVKAVIESGEFSRDVLRLMTSDRSGALRIWDLKTGAELYRQTFPSPLVAHYSSDCSRIAVTQDNSVLILRNTRPEWWWGFLLQLEFWMVTTTVSLFGWSLRRDLRTRRGKK